MKTRFLATTALLSIITWGSPAFADCNGGNTPGSGATVNCDSTTDDFIGVSGPAATGVTVNVGVGALIDAAAAPGIDLNDIAHIQISPTAQVTSQSDEAIRLHGSADIHVYQSGFIGNLASDDPGIVYVGASSTDVINVILSGGLSYGSFGNAVSNVSLDYTTDWLGGLDGGGGGIDTLSLGAGPGPAPIDIDTDDILNFEVFNIQGGEWTLTGASIFDWNIQSGRLTGTTANLGDIMNGDRVIFDQAINGIYSGAISGFGQVNFTGGATIELTGASTYWGGTTVIDATTLVVNADNNLGDAFGLVSLSDASTLRWDTAFDSARVFGFYGPGTTNVLNTNGNDVTLSGKLYSTSDISKTGAGTLTLTADNSGIAGNIIVDNGTLAVSADNNLGGTTTTVELDGGTLRYDANFNTGRDYIIGAAGGTIDTQAFEPVMYGIISGTGKLTKTGSGILYLGGANTYQGGTEIQAGTVGIVSDTGLGDASGDVTLNGGTLGWGVDFDTARDFIIGGSGGTINTNGHNVALTGVMSGAGDFTKSGAGMLTMTGNNTLTGSTAVTAGHLKVNGSNAASDTTITSGATLSGSGTVGGLINSGTVSPGNSIGTLNVTGDVTFNPGSTYEVEIDDAGNSDLIAATGNIILTGGIVNLAPLPGVYPASTLYTILTGTSVTGSFDGLTDNLAFFNALLIYNGADVQLQIDRVDFHDMARDAEEYDEADAVQDLGPGNAVFDAFTGLSPAQAEQALEDLSGEHNAGLSNAVAAAVASSRALIAQRQQSRNYRTGSGNAIALAPSVNSDGTYTAALIEPSAGGGFYGDREAWLQFTGRTGKTNADGSAPEQDRRSHGALMGADAEFMNGFIGVYGGWDHSDVETDSQHAKSAVNTYQLGMYGSQQVDHVNLNMGVSGAYHDIETERNLSFGGFSGIAKGDSNGQSLSGFVEAGVPLDLGFAAIEPYAGAAYTYTHLGGYTEDGAGAANLVVESTSTSDPSTTLGIRAGRIIDTSSAQISTRANLGWQHNYSSNDHTTMRFESGTSPFDVKGASSDRDKALLGLGLDVITDAGGLNAYADYNAALGKDDQDHAVTGGMNMKF